MSTNNTDIGKLIYDEACFYYPELFGGCTPALPRPEGHINTDFSLPALDVGQDALPPFLRKIASPPPCLTAPRRPYPAYDVAKIRSDFPILKETVNGRPLVWFDNAATTQKPACVIERLKYYYEHENSNVHRAAHTLARRTTEAYEGARRTIAGFLNAPHPENIVFVRGTTEAINLVASAYGLRHTAPGDEILLTGLEHHANIVPWQLLCKETGAALKFAPVDDSGQILLPEFRRLLSSRTKIVAFAHVSNVLGTITPAEEMIRLAHDAGAKVLVDGAQAVSHLPVDVGALDCDFYVFSGHKLFGPTGIGVLYGKTALLEEMPPYQGGGNMISDVTPQESRFKQPPHRFEAGTGSIADAVGLACAADYVSRIGPEAICRYEQELLIYAMEWMTQLNKVAVVGNAASKSAIISFFLKDQNSNALAALLDREGIAVRAGHHCAQPVLRRFGRDDVVRVSFALYNTFDEIDALISVLSRINDQY